MKKYVFYMVLAIISVIVILVAVAIPKDKTHSLFWFFTDFSGYENEQMVKRGT